MLEHILASRELSVENEDIVRSALTAFHRGKADFADYVIFFPTEMRSAKQPTALTASWPSIPLCACPSALFSQSYAAIKELCSDASAFSMNHLDNNTA